MTDTNTTDEHGWVSPEGFEEVPEEFGDVDEEADQ